MGKQVWGTFSVKDHLINDAFVAEVMLYDRLAIPYPPDKDEEERWSKVTDKKEDWKPDQLFKILEILGDRAYKVPWNEFNKDKWKSRYDAGTDLAIDTNEWAFAATRTAITEGLPRGVTGIDAVVNYTSLDQVQKELKLEKRDPADIIVPGGKVTAILGQEFLVPGDKRWEYHDRLKLAVELSSERIYKRKRANFWRWQNEFLSTGGITSQDAVIDAVEEMNDLLEEEKELIRKEKIKAVSQYAFLFGTIGLGLVQGPLSPFTIGAAFCSLGQFVSGRMDNRGDEDRDKPVALLRDIRKHFGWKN